MLTKRSFFIGLSAAESLKIKFNLVTFFSILVIAQRFRGARAFFLLSLTRAKFFAHFSITSSSLSRVVHVGPVIFFLLSTLATIVSKAEFSSECRVGVIFCAQTAEMCRFSSYYWKDRGTEWIDWSLCFISSAGKWDWSFAKRNSTTAFSLTRAPNFISEWID